MHPTPPLTFTPDSPEEAVLLMVMQIGKRMRQRQPGDEVDPATVPILHVLSCTGAIRLSDLAHRMQLDASTVSRHARQLEERGLISRTGDPEDRRASRVEVTELGQQTVETAFEQRKQLIGRVLQSWPAEDLATLQRLAGRFVADLSVADLDAADAPVAT